MFFFYWVLSGSVNNTIGRVVIGIMLLCRRYYETNATADGYIILRSEQANGYWYEYLTADRRVTLKSDRVYCFKQIANGYWYECLSADRRVTVKSDR